MDIAGKPYQEKGNLPLLHFLPVALATRGARDKAKDSMSTAYSTPILITERGTQICDSTRIMQYLSSTHEMRLFQAPESEALDAYFSEELGPHTRRYGYHFLLGDPGLLRELFWSLGNKSQAAAAIALGPVYSRVMRKALRINAATAARSKEKILTIAAEVEARLDDGREFLCGDTFGAADLSFSALMAPSLLLTHGEGYGSQFPSMERAGGEVADFAREMRDRRAGQFALQMYRDYRPPSAGVK